MFELVSSAPPHYEEESARYCIQVQGLTSKSDDAFNILLEKIRREEPRKNGTWGLTTSNLWRHVAWTWQRPMTDGNGQIMMASVGKISKSFEWKRQIWEHQAIEDDIAHVTAKTELESAWTIDHCYHRCYKVMYLSVSVVEKEYYTFTLKSLPVFFYIEVKYLILFTLKLSVGLLLIFFVFFTLKLSKSVLISHICPSVACQSPTIGLATILRGPREAYRVFRYCRPCDYLLTISRLSHEDWVKPIEA